MRSFPACKMQLLLVLSLLLCSVAGDYSLRAPTTAFVGDTILVEFGNFSKDTRSGCWIGLFDVGVDVTAFNPDSISGSQEPFTKTAPLKFFKCSNDDSKTFSNKGYGSKAIRILNYRNDLILLMFDAQSSPVLLASSAILRVPDNVVPSQEHLALTQNNNEMAITWTSLAGGQSVRWGTSSGNLGRLVSATSKTFTKNNLCGGIAQTVGWKSPGTINTAVLKNLPSSNRIFYQVGSGSTWSNVSSFVSPFQGSKTSLRVAIIGDTGVQDPDKTRYPGSVRPGTEFQSDDSGGDCGVTVSSKFAMPGLGSRVNGGWYSYSSGLVTFIHLNTELQVKKGSSQYLWLQSTLKNIDRKATPWVIVIGHRPVYIVSGRVSSLADLEALFYNYKVDLVVAGHIHYYMRTCFVYNGNCITQQRGNYAAPVYVVAGTGGASLAKLGVLPVNSPRLTILGNLDSHVVTGVSTYGYLDLEVKDTSTLKVNFIAPGPPTQVLDTLTIQRTR